MQINGIRCTKIKRRYKKNRYDPFIRKEDLSDYLYMNLLILILGVFSNGSAIYSTTFTLLYAGIDLLTSAMIAFLSDELVEDKIRVDGLAFFCDYYLSLEGGVDSGFQQVFSEFFV